MDRPQTHLPHPHKSAEELLHQDHYTPEELSELLDMGTHTIRHAAFTGDLRAIIINHEILSIRRADALDWLRRRG